MDLQQVLLTQVVSPTRQNTSTDQRLQVPIRLSLALFATQSATQPNLVVRAAGGR